MTITTENELKEVFHGIYRTNYPLESISQINALNEKFESHAESKEVNFSCESLISLIYSKNGLPEKSLEIDLKLLADTPPDHFEYNLILGTAVRNSAALDRTDEVVPYAKNYLKISKDDFYGKLPVLAWYVTFYPNGENGSFEEFEPVLSGIVTQMGAKINKSDSFMDRVNYLYLEFKRACKDLDLYGRSYVAATIEQGEKLLKDYLATEPLSFYHNIAKLYREDRLNPPNPGRQQE